MKPYYQDDAVTLYHGDCLELADLWTCADVLVTDPPYGIAWTRNGISRTSRADRAAGVYVRHQRHSANDAGIANDATTEARDGALRAWDVKPAYVFGSLLMPPPIGTKQVAIYAKPKDAGQLTAISGIARDSEAIYLLGSHTFGGGGRSSIFRTNAVTVGAAGGLAQRHQHPHVKPLDVLESLMRVAPPGVIADPFAGSGSTLVAAKALGRKAIGVELDERYCEIAARRLSQDILDFEVTA